MQVHNGFLSSRIAVKAVGPLSLKIKFSDLNSVAR